MRNETEKKEPDRGIQRELKEKNAIEIEMWRLYIKTRMMKR